MSKATNDGSSADYYLLPDGATQLQDLIAYRNMNAQLGEILRATYRYGQGHHSSRGRDLNKIIFYANAELERLGRYEAAPPPVSEAASTGGGVDQNEAPEGYLAVPEGAPWSCTGCAFALSPGCACGAYPCGRSRRLDNRAVIFKRISE